MKKTRVIRSSDELMNFGKYKLRTVQWVMDNDLSYLSWMSDNCLHIKLSKELAEQVNSLQNLLR